MALENQGVLYSSPEGNPVGLLYDADHVTLIGSFSDEMAAHRAKRLWIETLNNYFLIEPGRDFEIRTSCSLDEGKFLIQCSFASACGRYAFWRLINRQAAEAERKLGGYASNPERVGTLRGEKTAFILGGSDDPLSQVNENRTLIERIFELFR